MKFWEASVIMVVISAVGATVVTGVSWGFSLLFG